MKTYLMFLLVGASILLCVQSSDDNGLEGDEEIALVTESVKRTDEINDSLSAGAMGEEQESNTDNNSNDKSEEADVNEEKEDGENDPNEFDAPTGADKKIGESNIDNVEDTEKEQDTNNNSESSEKRETADVHEGKQDSDKDDEFDDIVLRPEMDLIILDNADDERTEEEFIVFEVEHLKNHLHSKGPSPKTKNIQMWKKGQVAPNEESNDGNGGHKE